MLKTMQGNCVTAFCFQLTPFALAHKQALQPETKSDTFFLLKWPSPCRGLFLWPGQWRGHGFTLAFRHSAADGAA
jgi:hypothetical protein